MGDLLELPGVGLAKVVAIDGSETTIDRNGERFTITAGAGAYYVPTPEELTALCRAIQSEWTPAERERRRVGPGRIAWTAPEAARIPSGRSTHPREAG